MRNIQELMAGMAVLDRSLYYYAITLTADRDGTTLVGTQSQWEGFADPERRIEIRAPSLMKPEYMIRCWELSHQPYVVVKNDDEWFLFYMRGGNALVEQGIGDRNLRTTLVATNCVRTNETEQDGLTPASRLPETALKRAPTPRLRMQVLNRDSRKCRICGRSPANHFDVELHTHHIRPWASGGLTIAENLITLCHTCHKGLDPHFDRSLLDHLPETQSATDFEDSVMRYREQIFKKLCEANKEAACERILPEGRQNR